MLHLCMFYLLQSVGGDNGANYCSCWLLVVCGVGEVPVQVFVLAMDRVLSGLME